VLDPDEALLGVVRDVLGFRSSGGLRVRPQDGRAGLAAVADASQDLVVRDAFSGMGVPGPLQTVEFVHEVARVLAPGGTYVANLSDRAPFGRLAVEVATVQEVLPEVVAVTDPATLRGRRLGNVILLASGGSVAGAVDRLTRVLASDPLPARVLDATALRSRLPRSRPLHDGDDTPAPPDQPSWG
jgi:spermidine synthase